MNATRVTRCADCPNLYRNPHDDFKYYCKELEGLTTSFVHRYVVNPEKPDMPEHCPMRGKIKEYIWSCAEENNE